MSARKRRRDAAIRAERSANSGGHHVIEVRVDVRTHGDGDEHAERFGRHCTSLRGRIGRGAQKSHCILVARGA